MTRRHEMKGLTLGRWLKDANCAGCVERHRLYISLRDEETATVFVVCSLCGAVHYLCDSCNEFHAPRLEDLCMIFGNQNVLPVMRAALDLMAVLRSEAGIVRG